MTPMIEATQTSSRAPADTIPQVAATATRTRSGGWDLRVLCCPYCARSHVHGGGDGPTPEDNVHRVPHCVRPLSDPRRGYVMVVVPLVVAPTGPGTGGNRAGKGRAK